jgi:hypothetical protein
MELERARASAHTRAAAHIDAEATLAADAAFPPDEPTTEYAALLADAVDGGDNTTAGREGLLRTTYPMTRPRRDGTEARAASVQEALPWLQEGAVSGVPPPADGAPPASYKPNSQSVQPIDANPGLYRNIAPLLEIQMQNAQVSGFVPPEETNRLWAWAGLDGA